MVSGLMEYAAFAIALLALMSAWSARAKLAALADELASLRSGGSGGDTEELSRRIDMNSRFLSRLASGESLGPDQIREGRLWAECSPEEGQALVAKGVRVLDVRTPQETASGVIPGAICIPVNELPQRASELERSHETTLIVCAAGVRSAAACQYLSEQGNDGLVNLEGGMSRWGGERVRPQ